MKFSKINERSNLLKKFEIIYFQLPEYLSKLYRERFGVSFSPYAITRVALDSVYKTDWHVFISKPAYANMTYKEYKIVIESLISYKKNTKYFLVDLQRSNSYRSRNKIDVTNIDKIEYDVNL